MPAADDVRYRTVTATGTYDSAHQRLVRLQTVNDKQGHFVLTPLTTASATLLVVRGFVGERGDGSPPTSIAAAPTGRVTVHARAQTGETRHDSPTACRPDSSCRSIRLTRPPGWARRSTTVTPSWRTARSGRPG
jgi:cytochrome oxidase assembly protein ShyY1